MTLPDGTSDWVIALWVVCGALSGVAGAWFAVLATRGQRRVQDAHQKAQEAKVDEVHRQVVNNHPTKPGSSIMREELDEVRDLLREVVRDIRGLRQDVGGLRGDDRAIGQRLTRLERLAHRMHPGETE